MVDVEYISHLGSDLDVVNAARVSFHKKTDIFRYKDENLIRYLAEHNHWTPFSHCYLKVRVKAPLFVARQLFKHKVGLTENEVSRRYVDEPPSFFLPTYWRESAEDKKQGSGGRLPTDKQISAYNLMDEAYYAATESYTKLLKLGVCAEQARMVLPQSMYTEWIWSGSLAAFARVCNLRAHADAQLETQLVANQIAELLEERWPVSFKYLVKKEEQND